MKANIIFIMIMLYGEKYAQDVKRNVICLNIALFRMQFQLTGTDSELTRKNRQLSGTDIQLAGIEK